MSSTPEIGEKSWKYFELVKIEESDKSETHSRKWLKIIKMKRTRQNGSK